MDHFVQKTKRKRSSSGEKNENDKLDTAKFPKQELSRVVWRKITSENLDCDYAILLNKREADSLMEECERQFIYNDGKLAEVFVFGKWHKIPRKQSTLVITARASSGYFIEGVDFIKVAYGDEGLSYSFSNNTVPALPWPPFMADLKDKISDLTGHKFNFVLINRYKDGKDHMGEHRDDEDDLVAGHPIASLSLGQPRDFIFRHAESRGKQASRNIEPVKFVLEHGSLLMMNHPTNTYWYHSLPPRKRLSDVRINMTFRLMTTSRQSPSKNTRIKKETQDSKEVVVKSEQAT